MNLSVYLMRHGRTASETPWRFLGQRDVPLSDEGRAQAASWRDELSGVNFVGAWCSDLARCRETASLILAGRGLAAEPVAGLREISLGEWDGLSVEEVKRLYPGRYEARGADIAGFRPPGGESFANLAARAWTALENILRAGSSGPDDVDAREVAANAREASLLVVAHAGVNRVLLCRFLGMPLDRAFSLSQKPCCLNIVSFGPGGARLRLLNQEPKL